MKTVEITLLGQREQVDTLLRYLLTAHAGMRIEVISDLEQPTGTRHVELAWEDTEP